MKFVRLVVAFLALSSPLLGGSEGSGGTDYHPDVPAWFTSQDSARRISVCYEISPTFIADPAKGVDAVKIAGWIVDTVRQWENYYHVTKGLSGEGWSTHDDLSKPPRDIIFTLDGAPKAGCQGGEDLSIYLGVENARVTKAKAKLYNPFAFAAIDSPNRGNVYGWTPGFVWIADTGAVDHQTNTPMWTNYDGLPLQRILSHELGHVFGCSHVPGTIMQDLSQWMYEKTQISHSKRPKSYFSSHDQARLLSIDESYDLVTRIKSTETYTVVDSTVDSAFPPPGLDGLFKRLVGRSAQGEVKGIVVRKGVPSTYTGPAPREGEGTVKLTDATGTYEFPFTVTTLIGEVETSGRVFTFGTRYLTRSSKAYAGNLKLLDGRSLFIGINYNLDNVRFSLVDLTKPHDPGLFGMYSQRFLLRAE